VEREAACVRSMAEEKGRVPPRPGWLLVGAAVARGAPAAAHGERVPRARALAARTRRATRAFGRGGVLPAIIYAGGRGSSAPRPSMADRWLRFAFDPFFLSSARRAHWGAQGAAPRPAHDGERSIEREPALGDDSELGRVRLPCSGARLMVLL
jgi:hypothetical protein